MKPISNRTAHLLQAALPVLLLAVSTGCGSREAETNRLRVQRGTHSVWMNYEGQIQSRQVVPVRADIKGQNTVISVIPEGTAVKKGDLLVEFDCSETERDYINLKSEYELAKVELDTLREATHPLELGELEIQILELKATYESENRYLEDTRELLKDGLVSEYEIKQQELKLEPIRLKLKGLENSLKVKKEILHPANLQKAEANFLSKQKQLSIIEDTLAKCKVIAPTEGIVIYEAAHMGGIFRNVRVGDTIWRNQQFMEIQNMDDLVVNLEIPEAELSRIAVGNPVTFVPLALPDLQIPGKVEQVGMMARTIENKPQWQKYFQVTTGLNQTHPQLRSGMSVSARILAYENKDCLLVPRECVTWDQGKSFVLSAKEDGKPVEVTLGPANNTHYEVLGGIEEGSVLLTP